MEVIKILNWVLISIEILVLLVLLFSYIYRQIRKVRYEKENRKLSVHLLHEATMALAEDNTKLIEENTEFLKTIEKQAREIEKLKKENAKLKNEKANDTAGKVYGCDRNEQNATNTNSKCNKTECNKEVATKKSARRTKRTADTSAN